MIKAVRNYIFPHKSNNYRPHLLGERSVMVLFYFGFILFCTSLGSSYLIHRTDFGALVLPAVLVDMTNDHRIENSQKPLSINPLLEQAALLKAKDMASSGYFAHTSPSGATPWKWFSDVGYRFVYAGENLAINFVESSDVEKAWIASPTHHANLISDKFDETGIATYDGVYMGQPTTFVVQLFGRRAGDRIVPPIPVVDVVSNNKVSTKLATNTEQKPIVKGEKTSRIIKQAPISPKEPAPVSIVNEPTFAVVHNIVENEPIKTTEVSQDNTQKYSTLVERILVKQSRYVQYTYLALIVLIYAVLVMTSISEFRIRHTKNIALGVLLICFLGSLAYINSSFIISLI